MRKFFNNLIAKLRGPRGDRGEVGFTGAMGAAGKSCHERIKFLRMGPGQFGPDTPETVEAIEQYINLVRPYNLVKVERCLSESCKDGNYVIATYRDELGYTTLLINLDTFDANSQH